METDYRRDIAHMCPREVGSIGNRPLSTPKRNCGAAAEAKYTTQDDIESAFSQRNGFSQWQVPQMVCSIENRTLSSAKRKYF